MNYYDLDELTRVQVLANDFDFMLLAIQDDEEYIKRASVYLRSNKDFAIKALSKYPKSLYLFSPALRSDLEVVSTVVKYDNDSFEFASDEVKDNIDFVFELIEHRNYIFQYVSDRLKDDEEIAGTALILTASHYKYISDRLKTDTFFIYDVILENYLVFCELDDNLKNDRYILMSLEKALIKNNALDVEYFQEYLSVLDAYREYDIMKELNKVKEKQKGVKKF